MRTIDKRGSNDQRAARSSALSIGQRNGVARNGKPFTVGAPVACEVPTDKRQPVILEDGRKVYRRVKGAKTLRSFRAFNACEWCGEVVYMLPDMKTDTAWRGEQDRIVPGGEYDASDNLLIACRHCNASRQDNANWEPAPYGG